MILSMPDNMWFAIGFGTNMRNTDMIGWHANGPDSYATDYYSTKKSAPEPDAKQDIEYYFNLFDADEDDPDDYPRVHFLTYRDLDTGDAEQDFNIELETEIDMVYGLYLASSNWNEHTARGTFKMNFNSKLGVSSEFQKIGFEDEINVNAEPLEPDAP